MWILAQTTLSRHKRHGDALVRGGYFGYDECEPVYLSLERGRTVLIGKLTDYLYQKKYFFLALILTLAVAWVSVTYIGMTQTPIDSIDLSPARDSGWTYTLADGTELTPDEAGNLPLTDAGATVYLTRSLGEYKDVLAASALLSVNTRTCDVAVFAEGELIADPTHRYNESDGSFAEAQVKTTGGGIFTLGIVEEITLAVKFTTGKAAVAMLPTVEIFIDAPSYYSQWMAPTAKSALPAGVFLAAALLLTLLFLIRLYFGKTNWSFLLLALLALTFGLLQTVSYSSSVIWFLQSPVIIWGIQVLPTVIVLWVLWYHTDRRVKKLGWMVPLLCTLCVAGGIVYRQIDLAAGAKWTNLLQGKILPAVLLISLLVCIWQAVRKNGYYRRFCLLGGIFVLGVGVVTLISYLRVGPWWQTLQTTAQNVAMLKSWFQPMQLVNKLLFALFFCLAFDDFITGIVRRNAELQALTLQNRYTAEHAAHLRRSLDDTHALRHEMRHHIEALKALCREGNLLRVSDYVERIGGAMGDLPGRYTDHPLVNALVASCAQRAKGLEADFEAIVQLPEQIAVEDTDLAVLISNMADNALEALAAVPEGKERRLQIKIEIFESAGLFVSCVNSFSGKLNWGKNGTLLSTKEGADHGLGLKAMHRVAEKYNSVLVVEQEEELFLAKTYLYFKQK